MSYTHRDGPADRFQAAMDAVADAKRYVATLRGELQECFDNLPGDVQDGDGSDGEELKGEEFQEFQEKLDAAIGVLGEVIDSLEDVRRTHVSFPSMDILAQIA